VTGYPGQVCGLGAEIATNAVEDCQSDTAGAYLDQYLAITRPRFCDVFERRGTAPFVKYQRFHAA
jgi:hypothetical protein